MSTKRKVEVFSAGCQACEETIKAVKGIACLSCDIAVHDMKDINVVKRAHSLGIRSVPAVVIDGQLAGCCANRGVNEAVLRDAGLGQSI